MDNLISLYKYMPTLETERLILRKLTVKDANDMFEYASDTEVTKYLLWKAHTSLSVTKNYLKMVRRMYMQQNYFDYAIVLKENGKMIGTCGFAKLDEDNSVGEIGYVLNKNYWGREIAYEAASKIVEFAFEVIGLNRVEARYMKGNERSRRVMEKLGFTYEGTLRSSLYVKGKYRDISYYSMLKSEYKKRK